MKNQIFGKNTEKVRKHRGIKLITTGSRRNYLVPEPNYYTTKCFKKNIFATKMRKTKMLLNMPVYLSLTVLKCNIIVMNEFWYD